MASSSPRPASLPRRARIIIALVVITAGAAFVAAIVVPDGRTSDISVTGNEAIDELVPARGADSVAAQSEVTLDLAAGYAGEIVAINGIAIPNDEANPGPGDADDFGVVSPLGQWSYRPDEGKVIERLDAPTTCVEGAYWPVTNPDERSTIQWCFTVI